MIKWTSWNAIVNITVSLVLTISLALEAEEIGVNVRDCGATGDGRSDDTAAFLNAVKQAQENRTHVFVPKGVYRVAKTIALENVAVVGPEGGAWPADIGALPSIIPTHHDGPGFLLLAAGSLRGLNIDYEWKKEANSGPPAILISGIGVYISNMRIRYPWDGILCDGKSNVGRLNIENVFMVSPRNIGIRVTGTWDVPQLNNIEVWNAGPVKRGLESGVGFYLGKNDLIRMTNCFAFAMQTGFLFDDEIKGCEIKGGTWGVMNGCSTDYCGRSIVVRGEHTLSISGSTFWTHAESLVIEGKGARVRISASELKSNGAPTIVVRGGDHTVVTGCSILRPMKSFAHPAVMLESGRTVLGSNHIESFGDGVVIKSGVGSAVVTGNQFDVHGHTPVVNQAGSKVLVKDNL